MSSLSSMPLSFPPTAGNPIQPPSVPTTTAATSTTGGTTSSTTTNNPQSSSTISDKDIQNVPKDAIIIEKILQSMGIKEFEPRVTEQLLELVYRYVFEVIEDSFVYMDHASRNDLDLEDIRLAIQSRVNNSYTEPPPVEVSITIIVIHMNNNLYWCVVNITNYLL